MPRYRFPALILAQPDPCQPMLQQRFPHVLAAIQAMWGYRELPVYLDKLAVDERGDREGFPKAVWDDLYLLMQLHRDVFPELAS